MLDSWILLYERRYAVADARPIFPSGGQPLGGHLHRTERDGA